MPRRYDFVRVDDPPRTLVLNALGDRLATLTDGARTAVFRGPARTFAEPEVATATVTTQDWVRVAPAPWRPGGEQDPVLGGWVVNELNDRTPDVLDISMQYRRNTPDLHDDKGVRYAGRAFFGPLVNGERVSDADFNDYLRVPWTQDGVVRPPDALRKDSLDCSGFLRMVFGYRSGYPLGGDPSDVRLPRQVKDFAAGAPGALVVANTGVRPSEDQLERLQAGDVLAFDLDPADGPLLDHSAIYLGVDSAGQPRFISSRKTYNAPTMGDKYGASVLSGDGVFAQVFRLARRL
jgi:cell wall-associated NlpC family hydrolase